MFRTQVFGCSLDEQLKSNVKELEEKHNLRKKILTGVLKRRPEILGYNVDCTATGGSCVGDCNRCWARF